MMRWFKNDGHKDEVQRKLNLLLEWQAVLNMRLKNTEERIMALQDDFKAAFDSLAAAIDVLIQKVGQPGGISAADAAADIQSVQDELAKVQAVLNPPQP